MKVWTVAFFIAFAFTNVSTSPVVIRLDPNSNYWLISDAPNQWRILSNRDNNGDGKIDLDEIKAALEEARLSSEDLDLLAHIFLRFLDLNEDGFITLDELRTVSDPVAFFKTIDKDGDGKVNFDEFKALYKRVFPDGIPDDGPEAIREAFDKADTDKDGYLSQEEFVALNQRGILSIWWKDSFTK